MNEIPFAQQELERERKIRQQQRVAQEQSMSAYQALKAQEKAQLEQEMKALHRNNERMEESDKFRHIDSAHLDMSKDGLGKNKHDSSPGKGQRIENQQPDLTSRQVVDKLKSTAPAPAKLPNPETERSAAARQAQVERMAAQQPPTAYQQLHRQEQKPVQTVTSVQVAQRFGYMRFPAHASVYTPITATPTSDAPAQLPNPEMERSRLARQVQLECIAAAASSGVSNTRRTASYTLNTAASLTRNDSIKGMALMTGAVHGVGGALQSGSISGNDTLVGLDKGYHTVKAASMATRFVFTGRPSARLEYQVRNPLGLHPERDAMDKQLAGRMMRNGKITRSPQRAARLAYREGQDIRRQILKKYGSDDKLLSASSVTMNREMKRLLDAGREMKVRIRALEAKGAALTPAQRTELARLKKLSRQTGQSVAQLKNMLRDKEKLAHLQQRVQTISRRAERKVAPKRAVSYGAISLASKALMEDENTQGLAYGIRTVSNKRVQKAAGGTAKLAVRTVTAPARLVLHFVAPNWRSDLRLAGMQLKRAVQKPVIRAGRTAWRTVKKYTPQPVKRVVKGTQAVVKKFAAVPTGIKNRFYRLQSGVVNSPPVLALRRFGARLSSAVRGFIGGVKKVAIRALALLAALALLLMIMGTIITSTVGGVSGAILSPEATDKGKIDLTPYAEILKSPNLRFLGQTMDAQSKYKRMENVKTKTTYAGVLNNTREILSMVAVRFKQNLDVQDNPDIAPYLTFLYDITHDLSVLERDYTCDGCKQKKQYVYTPDPETGEITMELKPVKYCPGHKDVHITVTVRGFDEIFYYDTYTSPYGNDDEWEGWTEENREWCKMIYDQDWSELYSGLMAMQGMSLGSITTSADAQKIWDYLMDFIGNPYGVAGLMGNLQAESGLASGNMENIYEGDLGLNDISYTEAVDSGLYTNFANDGIGYGLAQWTAPGRKAHLLGLASVMGASVSSLDVQLALLKDELETTFAPVLEVLKNAGDIQEASNCVLFRFEAPLDQSDAVQEWRASLAEYFFNRFVYGSPAETDLTLAQQRVCQVAMHSGSYGIRAEAGYCQRWAAECYAAAGFPLDSSGSAKQSGLSYGVSSDFTVIPPGAAIYGGLDSTYGHVGIYVGNGIVYHNIGYVTTDTLQDFITKYKAFAWGWEAGTDLTQQE